MRQRAPVVDPGTQARGHAKGSGGFLGFSSAPGLAFDSLHPTSEVHVIRHRSAADDERGSFLLDETSGTRFRRNRSAPSDPFD